MAQNSSNSACVAVEPSIFGGCPLPKFQRWKVRLSRSSRFLSYPISRASFTIQVSPKTSAMANPTPNFDNIAAATSQLVKTATILNTELPRIRNELRDIKTRLTRNENNTTRLRNSQRLAGSSTATLLPLQNPVTGDEIPNLPTTVAQINRLTAAEAERILLELQELVPPGTGARREAVREQFFS
jgi:hypothetical protein